MPHSNAANSLINSSLTILFIRMMRNARAPTLRIRLASVLGLLVRHATYISEELAATSVIEVLTEALKVRRRWGLLTGFGQVGQWGAAVRGRSG